MSDKSVRKIADAMGVDPNEPIHDQAPFEGLERGSPAFDKVIHDIEILDVAFMGLPFYDALSPKAQMDVVDALYALLRSKSVDVDVFVAQLGRPS
jgi:hypothetical protein